MTLSEEELYHFLALQLVPGIGNTLSKTLISYHKTAVGIFKTSSKDLARTPGIGETLAKRIKEFIQVEKKTIDREWEFLQKNSIRLLPFYASEFPEKLRAVSASPAMLFVKGNVNLNAHRMVAIVGTRKATAYGVNVTRKIVEDLKPYNVCIVSGLAYGIDIAAHKSALDSEMTTVAVVAHGLDRIYPPSHTAVANRMIEKGGIVSEYFRGVKPDKENFPVRNRIVAGMSDAIIVVEAAESGGALITADFARNFKRDVFAVPGRIGDTYSEGSNALINSGKAYMYTKVDDLLQKLQWDEHSGQGKVKVVQTSLFPELSEVEQRLFDILRQVDKMHIDQLRDAADMPISQLIPILTELEIKGAIIGLPGKMYQVL
ncbi:DNA processing protein DprA [Thermaurantimonas aggregans]|uniref:DNA processing protein DprA n=2 Tax=Thermaurantimonas aggregans TaxID=2173829 RepID=A0A401XJD5_9FLAO|nr:DNA processing protein DprA [Thermaurantimonas aggregans]